jgi:putative acetyltransferase
MKIIEIKDRNPVIMGRLLEVWEASVRATHLFLSEAEVQNVKSDVPQALETVRHLMVLEDETGRPAGFMGVEDGSLEMLFLAPEQRGKGLGRVLLEYGMEHYGVERLTVNEQNPQARGFYEHLGFRVCKRTELDEQGNPYPLLSMERFQE